MQLGMIGLGRMGANMARCLMGTGVECVVYALSPASVSALAAVESGTPIPVLSAGTAVCRLGYGAKNRA